MQLFILFFECGKVNIRSNNKRCDYYVQDFPIIYNKIITHFDKFPLISKKFVDYLLFKQAYLLLANREHLKSEGLRQIISIKASINNGLSEALKEAFPDIITAVRPTRKNISIYNPQ